MGVISEYDLLELCGKLKVGEVDVHSCAQYMTSPVKSVSPDVSLDVVAKIFKAASIGRLFVADGSRLLGVISRRDVLWHIHGKRNGSEKKPRATTVMAMHPSTAVATEALS